MTDSEYDEAVRVSQQWSEEHSHRLDSRFLPERLSDPKYLKLYCEAFSIRKAELGSEEQKLARRAYAEAYPELIEEEELELYCGE